jgi:DNA-binding NtrC family response regulator
MDRVSPPHAGSAPTLAGEPLLWLHLRVCLARDPEGVTSQTLDFIEVEAAPASDTLSRGEAGVKNKVLLIDDEPSVRAPVRRFLEASGYEIEEAPTVHSGEAAFLAGRADAVILDFKLPDGDALELLPRLKAIDDDVPVIILTGHGSIDLAVRAIKEGAEHFLTKPVEMAALATVLERALETRRTRRRDWASRRGTGEDGEPDPFLGASPKLAALAEEALLAVGSDSPVLILGETGSGKGLLARWLHANSARAREACVDLNCAGLSRELLESELFGHARGAFTGAVHDKKGLLEVAHHGTLFLDEIGDLDPAIQPRLLKALEEKRFRRLGETNERRVDVRLIAATHQDLARLVQEKRFRSDLYFRINTLVLRVPPLRERPEDIPSLAESLLRRLAAEMGRGAVTLSQEVAGELTRYAWPGNVRELRNVLERGLLACDGPTLERRHLRFERVVEPAAAGLPPGGVTLEELERLHIQQVLEQERGQVIATAERLGIPRSTLYQKIKAYGLDPAAFRA